MKNRLIGISYKNINMHYYKGSNWVYVGNRVFESKLSAKRHITKVLKHFNNCPEKTWQYYKGNFSYS